MLDPDDIPYTLETIRILLDELEVPLIGFAGAPFTLASYLIEGAPSRDHTKTKALMHGEPTTWSRLMQALTDRIVIPYLRAQAGAGVHALQLFDSWVGTLDPDDYREHVLPWSSRIFSALQPFDVPLIHFGTGTGELLGMMREAGAGVVGVDWRVPLDVAWDRIGHDAAIQGNLDPAALLGSWDAIERKAERVLDRAGGRPGHVFNLGHGVLPATPPEHLQRLVDLVHRAHRGGSMSPEAPLGLLVMAYGTASGPDDVERYYTDIRGGRTPSPELIEELKQRYAAIGNEFPLDRITREQAAGLEGTLNRDDGRPVRAYVGYKHSPPFVGDAVRLMWADGIREAVGIVMAPHFAEMSIGGYISRARDALPAGLDLSVVESWHLHPAFLEVLVERVARCQAAPLGRKRGRTTW